MEIVPGVGGVELLRIRLKSELVKHDSLGLVEEGDYFGDYGSISFDISDGKFTEFFKELYEMQEKLIKKYTQVVPK